MRRLKLRFSLPFLIYGVLTTVVGVVAHQKIKTSVESDMGRWAAYSVLALMGVFYPLATELMARVLPSEK